MGGGRASGPRIAFANQKIAAAPRSGAAASLLMDLGIADTPRA